MFIGQPPKRLIQQVMQAQMTGLILGALVQLALADSYSLAHHIHDVEGLQLLHNIAMARTQHAHPELQDGSEVKQLRPDVHEKVFQVYRQVDSGISMAWHAYMRDVLLQLLTRSDSLHPMGTSTIESQHCQKIGAVPCHWSTCVYAVQAASSGYQLHL